MGIDRLVGKVGYEVGLPVMLQPRRVQSIEGTVKGGVRHGTDVFRYHRCHVVELCEKLNEVEPTTYRGVACGLNRQPTAAIQGLEAPHPQGLTRPLQSQVKESIEGCVNRQPELICRPNTNFDSPP